jgi:hypothetical protein
MARKWRIGFPQPQCVTGLIATIVAKREMFPEGRYVIMHPESWAQFSDCTDIMFGCATLVDGVYTIDGLQVMLDPKLNVGVIVVR